MSMAKPTLLVVDVQKAWDDPGLGSEKPSANNKTSHRPSVADGAVARRNPDRHRAARPIRTGRCSTKTTRGSFQVEAAPRDGEPVLTKDVNSAFIGTDLEERLRAAGATTVITAITTTTRSTTAHPHSFNS